MLTTIRKTAKRAARRTGAALVIGALILLVTGDGGVGAIPPGIDPLDVLSLQVRPAAYVVLDSSGSMRERPDAVTGDGNVNTPVEGEVAGDDRTSKLYQAKRVLAQVLQANQTKVSFEFGRYVQSAADYTPTNPEYLYSCTTVATAPEVACTGGTPAGTGGTADYAYVASGLDRAADDERTAGGVTTYQLFSNTYRVNVRFRMRSDGAACGTATEAPGAVWPGVSAGAPAANWDNLDPNATQNTNGPPFIEVRRYGNTGCTGGSNIARFYFRGIRWNKGNTFAAGGSCSGFQSLVGLSACNDDVQIDTIGPRLGPEVIPGLVDNANLEASNPTAIRASGFTPISNSLQTIRTDFTLNKWSGGLNINAMTVKPRTFVIFLTDGDDTCSGTSAISFPGTDNDALHAAHDAQQLYAGVGPGFDPASKVTTFVVAFGTGVAQDRADWIAWGGSGMDLPDSAYGSSRRWNSIPTAAQRAACTTCVDAFVATDVNQLSAALQAAIDQGQSSGTFSDQQSITESLFEYASVAPAPPSPGVAADPMNPDTRYTATVPVLLQSTFDMPLYEGHLKAFRNSGGTALELWDAGAKLVQKVSGMGTTNYRFDLLHANATAASIAGSAALIKRRIFTTTRAGVAAFLDQAASPIVANLTDSPYFQPPEQISIWPPATGTASPPPGVSPDVDPASATDVGRLDTALGLTSANYPTVLDFKTAFGACTRSPSGGALPAGITCTDTDVAGTANWNHARKEARQITLAFMAGANLVKSGGLAVRTSVAPTNLIQFVARPSIMAESTLAAPAVVAPPLQANPQQHTAEYQLFRDGDTLVVPRPDLISRGFGLRNPDQDGDATSASSAAKKPSMSVVYHATNNMLHAFRAGPCPGACAASTPSPSETGGEELWGFVPYDQLGKLRLRLQPQTRDSHTYMLAAPIRFADVFVPGPFSIGSVSGDGVWRTVLLFGRGIGGKHITALDVTTPGPFTKASLDTNPPIHLWTRGNPDTQDLTPGGTKNNQFSNPAGTANFNAYAKMGETWSVPSVSFVTAANNTTARKSGGIEFVAYVGSGFSTVATEGSTFFTLDVLTGDVIASSDVGDRAAMAYENALVASPAAFQPSQLVSGFVGHPASAKTERIYIGDVHGRLWRFLESAPGVSTMLADFGATQPVANAVGLLNYAGTQASVKPHIFVETGNDNRVPATGSPLAPPPFKMFGLRDDDLGSDPNAGDGVAGPVTVLFTRDFPAGYRGVVQPATAYNGQTPPSGLVFFAGVKFNPTSAAPNPPPCASSFDSIIFAFGAESGGAAYDFGGPISGAFQMTGQRVQGIRGSGGQLVVDRGLQAQNPPPAPAPAVASPQVPAPQANVFLGSAMSNPLAPNVPGDPIPGLLQFRLGSSACK